MTRFPRLGVAAALVLMLGGSASAQQSVPSAEVTESRGLRIHVDSGAADTRLHRGVRPHLQ